ncbi:MAG: hypothetical protein ABI972_25655, partial [Acidobacteriota bacterium]
LIVAKWGGGCQTGWRVQVGWEQQRYASARCENSVIVDLHRVLERDVRDLERIIAADEAILDHEKSPEKSTFLRSEIIDCRDKIDRLRSKIENL